MSKRSEEIVLKDIGVRSSNLSRSRIIKMLKAESKSLANSGISISSAINSAPEEETALEETLARDDNWA